MTSPAEKLNIETMAQTEHDCLVGTPWETLGAKVPDNASVHEMLVAANLDWKVLRFRSQLVGFGTGVNETDTVTLDNPDAFALVRSTDKRILSPFTGPRYKPIQNQEAFEVFAEFVAAGQMTMETAGSLSDGQHIWGLASIGDGFELVTGETIKGYFLLKQSHLYGNALTAMFTPVRYPGGHTLVQNITLKGVNVATTYKMSHARVFNDERIEEIKKLLSIAEKSLASFREKAEFLAKMRISDPVGIRYLVEVFNPELIKKYKREGKQIPASFISLEMCPDANRVVKKVAGMINEYSGHDLPSCDGTVWGYYNTVAYAFDHAMGHNVNTRLESAWLGKNRGRKQKAFNLAQVVATKSGKKR